VRNNIVLIYSLFKLVEAEVRTTDKKENVVCSKWLYPC